MIGKAGGPGGSLLYFPYFFLKIQEITDKIKTNTKENTLIFFDSLMKRQNFHINVLDAFISFRFTKNMLQSQIFSTNDFKLIDFEYID